MTAVASAERLVPLADFGERLSALRLADACAVTAMRASLKQHGQLSAVRAFEREGVIEVFDGFKRVRAAHALGLRSLRAVVSDVDAILATVQMRELHAGRGLTALEEAWIVRALYREHRISQGEIAARLRCHKSWVCRRLALVESLDPSVQADVRLGLLTPRAAILVAALPRDNQSPAAGVVIRRALTVRQTALLIRELTGAVEPTAREQVLTRWSEQGPGLARRVAVSSARGIPEMIARDVTTVQRCAGRLQACLLATPLAAIGPVAGGLSESLGALDGVLRALSQTISSTLPKGHLA